MSDAQTAFVPSRRFAPPEKLSVSLVAPEHLSIDRTWHGVPAEVLSLVKTAKPGRIAISGDAGTGVSSLVVDCVLERIKAGVSPAEIVVLGASKESSAQLRRDITAALPQLGYVSDSPLVRSVHSFAFALVRLASQSTGAADGSAPRLITGAEHDVAIRELLEVQAESGGQDWPESVREALGMVGFARQLRDFLLRAQERGQSADDLIELGQRFARPMWTAAGRFLAEYQELSRLSGAQLYNASELVTSALHVLDTNPQFFAEQAARVDTIVVDDMQHLDPKSAELVQRFADQAGCAIIAGNPNHAVFHFRGATAASLTNFQADHRFELTQRLRPVPETSVLCCDTQTTELLHIADVLRRKNLIEGVAWKDMAVIVRSSAAIATVRRALLSAGVPVTIQPTDVVLAEQRLVSNLLLACQAITQPLSVAQLEELILGPIGGADSVTLRRLLRGLRQAELKTGGTRRAMEVFFELALADAEPTDETLEFLTEREQEILTKIRSVLRAGVAAHRRGESVEMVLWEVWDATGLSDRLMNASLRGGALGSSADLDLDAVMALFDAAGDFVERRPTAGIARFVQHVTEQELPTGARDRRGEARDAVALLTAHATGGSEWRVVLVAGVQEGTWPSLGETGTLFGQEELVDWLDNHIEPDTIIARTSERVAEERRLFRLATSRATDTLMVSAVLDAESDEVDEPSRFLIELAREHHIDIAIIGQDQAPEDSVLHKESLGYEPQLQDYPRLLSLPSIVAELRRVLENPEASPRAMDVAAGQLARLADAGVYGAHPDHWWGLAGPSSTAPVLDISQGARISPSKIESGMQCPLRATLSGLSEEDETPIYLLKGTLVHAAAEAFANGVSREVVEQKVRAAYEVLLNSPRWREAADLAEWDRLIGRTLDFVQSRDLVGTEVSVRVEVSAMPDGTPIWISGRMDRLERNADGEFVIVDLKTGKTAVAQKDMAEHAQLAAYQLALSRGELTESGVRTAPADAPGMAVGLAELVYPGTETVKITHRSQAPKTVEELQELANALPQLVADLHGPELQARVCSACDNCQLKPICPAHNEGRPLTHV
ncbi:ATP-dependent DNA helicase [Staphylococcus chromogenes]|nr:ATP-dependent DNA helicase [Staphylococcus chromogenes]